MSQRPPPSASRSICPGMRSLLVLVLCVSAAGCAAGPGSSDAARDDSFASGANRKPTPQTLYAMSRILASQGRDIDCQALLARIIRQWPKFMPAYSSLAESQMRARRMDEAIATLSAGLKISPGDPVLINDIGMCCLVKQEFSNALERFISAAALAPSDARYRGNMAMALGLLGRYDESLALYLQIVPAPDAHFNLAVLCQGRNDAARAREEFRKADALRASPKLGDSQQTPPGSSTAAADANR